MIRSSTISTRGRRTGLLVAAAALSGLAAIFAGFGIFAARLAAGAGRAADAAGALLGIAGVALLVLAFALALRGRGWPSRVLAVLVGLALLQWFVVPLVGAALVTNARPVVAGAQPAGARNVAFGARDGVALAGWYAPGRNGDAIVLVHGSHGSRADVAGHFRMLTAAGYGVLAFDARGHGESGGSPNALGWHGADDVAGAVAFLRRSGIASRPVAALGLSMGGEEALRAAGTGVELAAVVADGAGASTAADSAELEGGPIARSVTWMTMRATELAAGDREPAPLKDVARDIDVPVLLIASGARDELQLDRLFERRIGRQASLWHVPDARHTEALDVDPQRYAARVLPWLRSHLRETPRLAGDVHGCRTNAR